MNAISQVFWEDTLENGTVSHVAGQAGSPWSVLISLNAHGMNSLTASHLDILNCTSCHMGLFCWIVPIRTKAVPNFCLFQTHKQYSEQHALSKQTARLFFDFRTDLKNKTRQLIWSLHWRNSRANRKWGTNKAYTNGQRTSLRTRSQCFPLEGPLPRLKLTHSQSGTGFSWELKACLYLTFVWLLSSAGRDWLLIRAPQT